jgi:hypothetical protein
MRVYMCMSCEYEFKGPCGGGVSVCVSVCLFICV